jgi:hypothetical protein
MESVSPSNPPPQAPTQLRRRQFLAVGAWGSLAVVGLKAAVTAVASPSRKIDAGGVFEYLPQRLMPTVATVAIAIVGSPGIAAYETGAWRPERRADELLAALSPADRANALLGMRMFEHGTWSLRGFSQKTPAAQQRQLAAWRHSRLPLRRAVWGLLHGIAASSFALHASGWQWLGYPGPCLAVAGFAGRAPGQSAAFAWDERVP